MKPRNFFLGSLVVACSVTYAEDPQDLAAAFGALEAVQTAALSADGKKLVYVGAGAKMPTAAVAVDLETRKASPVVGGDGNPTYVSSCGWSATDRVVCQFRGLELKQSVLLEFSRIQAMGLDGSDQQSLGTRPNYDQFGIQQNDGEVIGWLNGADGFVLMARNHLPDPAVGLRPLANTAEGLGVDRIDTRTGKAIQVERPGKEVASYISDGLGNIRVMTSMNVSESGFATGFDTHSYRLANDRQWRRLGTFTADRAGGGRGKGIIPLAVDPVLNAAYVLDTLNGRRALFRVTLTESLKRDLAFSSEEVDVDGVLTIGRTARVIGALYTTDRRRVHYFDPDYQKVHAELERLLPNLPVIELKSASADENVLLLRASSDVEPGRWYTYHRDMKALAFLAPERPRLNGVKLSPVRTIAYPAADGTRIPAYLTLPPGVTEARNLPAIVMPHGGPDARDEWGFNWLAQYFAQRGFVIIQPNFRGSGGYGDAWFANNGYRGWKTSVGDVCDAGRWLVAQGIADPAKLAAMGWSYGGYASLQANVLDANLFKAVIAIAPMTDLAQFKKKRAPYFNSIVQGDFIGNGPHVKEGSPAQNVHIFKAPVLMFHGGKDIEFDIGQSRSMHRELRRAGKWSRLIEFTNLEHELKDSAQRAHLLRTSEEFLRRNLGLQ